MLTLMIDAVGNEVRLSSSQLRQGANTISLTVYTSSGSSSTISLPVDTSTSSPCKLLFGVSLYNYSACNFRRRKKTNAKIADVLEKSSYSLSLCIVTQPLPTTAATTNTPPTTTMTTTQPTATMATTQPTVPPTQGERWTHSVFCTTFKVRGKYNE